MDETDVVYLLISIVVVIIIPGLIIAYGIAESRTYEARWREAGWQVSPIKQPVQFAIMRRMKRKRRTRYVSLSDRYGAVTSGRNGTAFNTEYSNPRSVAFLANPFRDFDFVQLVTSKNGPREAGSAKKAESGDPDVMDARAWKLVDEYIQQQPLEGFNEVLFSENWIAVVAVLGSFGPNESLAHLHYLRDIALTAEGKATSGTDHKTAARNAAEADHISWRRKKRYAEATGQQA